MIVLLMATVLLYSPKRGTFFSCFCFFTCSIANSTGTWTAVGGAIVELDADNGANLMPDTLATEEDSDADNGKLDESDGDDAKTNVPGAFFVFLETVDKVFVVVVVVVVAEELWALVLVLMMTAVLLLLGEGRSLG